MRPYSKTATVGCPHRSAGIAAVEFAIILPILIGILGLSIFFGRVLMYYTVAQKSAQSAASYLASVPKSEMASNNQAEEHVKVAQWMADEMMADVKSGVFGNSGSQVLCDGRLCGMGVPKKITVVSTVYMFDEFFSAWTAPVTGPDGITLDARVHMDYRGK